MNTVTNLEGYEAALSSAAFYVQPGAGTLRLGGTDRIAFLQRQTTNDLNRLAPERSVVTVLTSPMARILDVLRLLGEEDSLTAITLPGRGAATARFLKSHIFFMDKVTVTDLSAEFAQIDLEGPNAQKFLPRLGFDHTPDLDEFIAGNLADFPLRAIGQPGFAGLGYRLILPVHKVDEVTSALVGQEVAAMTDEIYHTLRVEAGVTAPQSELTEEYTPLEVGLDWAVAEDKGCYTGQEVIARQITYDKVTQHLAGLRLSTPAQPGEHIWFEGKSVGTVTSVAHSPRFGEIALAILKRPHHQPDTTISIGESQAQSAPATVSELPFNPVK